MHDDGAGAQRGVLRHMGVRGDEHGKLIPGLSQKFEQSDSRLRTLDLTHGDQSMGVLGPQPAEIGIAAKNGVAQDSRTDLLDAAEQSHDLETPFILDHIDARTGVTPGSH
jgi:hypothetical protein